LSPDTYARLEEKFGKKEAKEIVEVLGTSVQAVENKVQNIIDSIPQKADFLITQKKFELKDELTKELATKADIVRLEGEINTVRQEMQTVRHEIQTSLIKLDRKFSIMFLTLLFAIIFLNQNSLEFIAKLLGLIKP
jgi:hypothetical protein